MRMTVDDSRKLVSIWLTGAEQQDDLLMAALPPCYAAYAGKKYHVAVFRSGAKDLPDLTEGLLLHNRTASARGAVEQLS